MPPYHKISVDDLPNAPTPTVGKKEIDEAVGATAFGMNLYTADPDQQIPLGYHYHPEHEELMYVLDGELEFETDEGTYTVETGDAFFVPAGSPHKAFARGETQTRFLAVGAPKERDHAVIVEPCSTCGERTRHSVEPDGEEFVLVCDGCGGETNRFSP